MSNPFVFAVMNAFRGKLPKPVDDKAKNETPPPAAESAPPPPQPPKRED